MSTKNKEQTIDINDLHQDQHNFNRGTAEGTRLMDKSFQELGAGRSILLDKDNNIIAGNKSQLAAIRAGIKKVRVIETTGDELVAVRRTDIDINSRKGRELALADNATTQANLSWDEAELATAEDEYGINCTDWAVKCKAIANPITDEPQKEKDTKELKLVFTPEEYQFVLNALRQYGDDFSHSFLQILGIA